MTPFLIPPTVHTCFHVSSQIKLLGSWEFVSHIWPLGTTPQGLIMMSHTQYVLRKYLRRMASIIISLNYWEQIWEWATAEFMSPETLSLYAILNYFTLFYTASFGCLIRNKCYLVDLTLWIFQAHQYLENKLFFLSFTLIYFPPFLDCQFGISI